MIWLRLAWREIRNGKRFASFFIFNLSLGLLGFVALDSFKIALDASLSQRSKVLLSSDLAISARRPLTAGEQKIMRETVPSGTREGQSTEMYSMVASSKTSRLAEIAAIDETYPFYGYIQLENGGKITGSSPKRILDRPVAWIYPELALQLGVGKGDSIRIGNTSFEVDDLIVDDTGSAWRGFSLATRIYIGLPQLASTGLIRKGTTAFYSSSFLLPEGKDSELLAQELNRKLTDPGIQVRTHRNASEEVGRLLGYLNDYLGLVALVALFLAGIGAGYLFRSFLSRRTREIAILTSLGVTNDRARLVYLIQLALLGAIAAVVTSALAFVSLPAIGWIAQPYLPFPIELRAGLRTLLLALLMGSIGSVLICYPILMKIRDLNPSALFQESSDPSTRFTKRQLAGALPGLIVLGLLAVWQSHSWRVGLLFMVAFLGSGLILGTIGVGILSALKWLEPGRGFRARNAFRTLRRSRLSSISCFIAIGIGTLLLNLIPSLQENLDSELTEPSSGETPSLFLFDIQEEQLPEVENFLSENSIRMVGLSPLIRARLSSINGVPFEKTNSEGNFATREEEREARSRNRGYNLSYRTQYSKAETLWKGRDFSGPFDPASGKPAEISVEKRFAERLKIQLGDRLEFDIQGLPVEGVVVNLRKVRWTSFQPNFFILFQPGFLDDAPKTYIGAVPKMELARKIEIQNGLVSRFPNVSMVDVADVVSKILDVFRQMSWALRAMAYLSLFAGFVVLFSIANHQASSRRQEINLLKVLGAGFGDVRAMIQIEFAILGFASALIGTLLSYGVSYLITAILFDGVWIFSWKLQLGAVAAVTVMSVATAGFATRRVLALKPLGLLQESGA